jgi:hypothetical protein
VAIADQTHNTERYESLWKNIHTRSVIGWRNYTCPRSQISRVNCPRCGVNTPFKKGKTPIGPRASTKDSQPYDWTRTYRKGQTMAHPTFGFGETPAVIEPQKIAVPF